MTNNNNPSMIPNSMRNPSKEFPYIGESVDLYDGQLEKNQQTINSEVNEFKNELWEKDNVPVDMTGLGRVYLRKNSVNGYPTDTWLYTTVNNVVYLLYSYNLQLYAVYSGGVGLGLENNLVVAPADYNISDISSLVGSRYLTFTESGSVYTITKPDNSTITSTEINNTNIYKYSSDHKINVLTQSMIAKSNTIYHIQYDYDLMGQTINVPKNCVLKFEGGSISNGTLVLNNTTITGKHCFGEGMSFEGDLKNNVIELDIFKDNSEPFENIGKLLGDYNIHESSGQSYNSGKTFIVPKRIYTISKGLSILGCTSITINCSGSTFIDTISEIDESQYWTTPMIYICDSSNITLKNIKYKYSTQKQLRSYNSSIIGIGARWTITANKLTHNISIINFEGDGTEFIPSADDNYGLTAIGALGEIQNIHIENCKWVGPITAFSNFEWSSRGDSLDNYYGLRPNNIYINNIIFEDVTYEGRCKGLRFSSSYNIFVSNVYAHNCDRTIMFANGDWGIARTHQVSKFANVVHKNEGENPFGDCFYFLTLYNNPDPQDSGYEARVNRYPSVTISNCITEGLSYGILFNSVEGNITVNNSIFEKCYAAISGYVAYNRGMLLIENSTFLKCNYAVSVNDMSWHIKDSIFTKDEEHSNRIMPKITNAAYFGNNRSFIIEGCEFNTEGTRNNVDILTSIAEGVTGRFKCLIIKDNIFKNTSASYPGVKCSTPLYTYFDGNKGDYITSNEYNATNFNSDNCNIDLINYRGDDANTEIVLDTRYGVNYSHGRSTAIIKGIRTDDYIEEVKITKIATGSLTIKHNQTIVNGYGINTTSGTDEVITERGIIVLKKPYADATFYCAFFQKGI